MKVTSRKYALALIGALESSKDSKATVRNFLAFLWRRKQFRFLPKILRAFEEEWNKKMGIVKCDVRYPKKFESALEDLKAALKKDFKKEVIMVSASDDSLIGGYQIRFFDTLIDASVSGQLQRLKQKLISTHEQSECA